MPQGIAAQALKAISPLALGAPLLTMAPGGQVLEQDARLPMKPLARPVQHRAPEGRTREEPPPQGEAGRFPSVRMRRNRKSAWSRRLVAENVLTPADLIWPIFVTEGRGKRISVPSMPGIDRLSVDLVVKAAEDAVALGIPAIALFPYTDARLRSEDGAEAFNPDNLVCRATRAVRKAG